MSKPIAYITPYALDALERGASSRVRVWRNPDEEGEDIPLYTAPPSVDALKEELRVTEQNLADCMAKLHDYDCKVDALIAEAVAKEREACALECESRYGTVSQFATSLDCVAYNGALGGCAEAIRARSAK